MMQRIKTSVRVLTLGILRCLRDFFLNRIGGAYLCPRVIRALIYRIMGNKKTIQINAGCYIGGNKLSIGKGTFVSYHCFLTYQIRLLLGIV